MTQTFQLYTFLCSLFISLLDLNNYSEQQAVNILFLFYGCRKQGPEIVSSSQSIKRQGLEQVAISLALVLVFNHHISEAGVYNPREQEEQIDFQIQAQRFAHMLFILYIHREDLQEKKIHTVEIRLYIEHNVG